MSEATNCSFVILKRDPFFYRVIPGFLEIDSSDSVIVFLDSTGVGLDSDGLDSVSGKRLDSGTAGRDEGCFDSEVILSSRILLGEIVDKIGVP